MLKTIDLNCDLAELEDGSDIGIMPYISSCNIACGGHASSFHLMNTAVKEAVKYGVRIGAHPGYNDIKNFGRVSNPMTKEEINGMMLQQLTDLQSIVIDHGVQIDYVKLHGALYHDTSRDKQKAEAVFLAIRTLNPALAFLGKPGTFHENSKLYGLNFYAESFADRRYQDNGDLVSRTVPGSVLTNESDIANQVTDILNQFVRSADGKKFDLIAKSICLHGDNENSISIAKAIKKLLSQYDIAIKSFLV